MNIRPAAFHSSHLPWARLSWPCWPELHYRYPAHSCFENLKAMPWVRISWPYRPELHYHYLAHSCFENSKAMPWVRISWPFSPPPYYRHLPRAPLKEYIACGQYSFLLALGWYKLALQAGIALPLIIKLRFRTLKGNALG